MAPDLGVVAAAGRAGEPSSLGAPSVAHRRQKLLAQRVFEQRPSHRGYGVGRCDLALPRPPALHRVHCRRPPHAQ
eukprot:6363791-Prorocentrum_lima.AAC.1